MADARKDVSWRRYDARASYETHVPLVRTENRDPVPEEVQRGWAMENVPFTRHTAQHLSFVSHLL